MMQCAHAARARPFHCVKKDAKHALLKSKTLFKGRLEDKWSPNGADCVALEFVRLVTVVKIYLEFFDILKRFYRLSIYDAIRSCRAGTSFRSRAKGRKARFI